MLQTAISAEELGIRARRWAAAHHHYCGEVHQWRKGRNSPRGTDGLTAVSGPKGPWDDGPHDLYVNIVARYLTAASDLLGGFGALCRPDGDVLSPVVLARASFEHSARALWLLDPRAGWPARAARAHLEHLSGLEAYEDLMSRSQGKERNELKRHRKAFRRKMIPGLFDSVDGAVPAQATVIAGESWLEADKVGQAFDEAVGARRTGERYDAFAASVHPNPVALQLLSREFGVGEPSARQRLDVEDIQALLRAITTPWIAAHLEWARYNAWDPSPLQQLASEIAATVG
ncbi:MAG: hypothetical protein JWL70_613 [Acidimicrobiia bacterium]|nr:hypothetical protein [Acidimicrobiia bacterium]